ncbi:hypothetical protein SKAU_G00054330 [Synaphobranchus kaupii]|uniref:Uncharacterized protein n=1 Tax=Synaphobranchus kaupii TaxID=118154 RepID=A0A9Q1J9R4_SYNKA|nr:hypothetical protein SKAU_G00054330 [Synaphobranchus kaupii]
MRQKGSFHEGKGVLGRPEELKRGSSVSHTLSPERCAGLRTWRESASRRVGFAAPPPPPPPDKPSPAGCRNGQSPVPWGDVRKWMWERVRGRVDETGSTVPCARRSHRRLHQRAAPGPVLPFWDDEKNCM